MQETPVQFLGWEVPLEKGIGYPLQYSGASQLPQLVKNRLQCGRTWVRSLGWEDPLQKGIPLQYSGLENSTDCRVRGVTKSRTQLSDLHWEVRASQAASVVKNLPVDAGDERDLGSVPGSERSSVIGNANPLLYSCLENSMGRGAWWATVQGLTKS